jgi:hypothetical protein
MQGICTALALGHDGWTVDLIDRSPAPMLATSVRGEGKLHLGYVYANDQGRSTASLMVDGALRFSDLLDRWLPEPLDWTGLRSEPFLYGVLPGSMLEVDALAEHYASVDEQVAARLADGCRYAGATAWSPVRTLRSPAEHGLSGEVLAAFATSEVAVDPRLLRTHLVTGLAAAEVTFHGATTVNAVEDAAHGFTVSCTSEADEEVTHRADVVINCSWDGRLAIDATMGIAPPRPWIYRLKYAVHGTAAAAAPPPPSVTLVLGPFGDVVRYADDRVYASWYPACLAGSSGDVVPPASWAPALSRTEAPAVLDELATSTVDALSEHVPALRGMCVDAVAAGVIVAWGETDIDEVDSELHRRHDIGVHDHGGYLSVDTGKLTTAPLFAQRVADLLRR